MGEWMNGWIDGWLDRCIDGCVVDPQLCNSYFFLPHFATFCMISLILPHPSKTQVIHLYTSNFGFMIHLSV